MRVGAEIRGQEADGADGERTAKELTVRCSALVAGDRYVSVGPEVGGNQANELTLVRKVMRSTWGRRSRVRGKKKKGAMVAADDPPRRRQL